MKTGKRIVFLSILLLALHVANNSRVFAEEVPELKWEDLAVKN